MPQTAQLDVQTSNFFGGRTPDNRSFIESRSAPGPFGLAPAPPVTQGQFIMVHILNQSGGAGWGWDLKFSPFLEILCTSVNPSWT